MYNSLKLFCVILFESGTYTKTHLHNHEPSVLQRLKNIYIMFSILTKDVLLIVMQLLKRRVSVEMRQ
jgi:hypothetical protein